MSAPLPLGLRNPYAGDDMPHEAKLAARCWDEGARAVIARMRTEAEGEWFRGRDEIGELADQIEAELKGET